MIYKSFGKTDLKVSAVGLGCEYIWHTSEAVTTQVLERAIAAGINYYDVFVATPSTREYYGKTLKKYRDRIYLAAHLGAAELDGQYAKTRDLALCRHFMEEFFDKLQTDYADILFLHNCDQLEDLHTILNGGMYDYAQELKAAGKARYLGISTHSTRIALEAVKSGKFDVLMFPVNPLFNLLPQDIADFRMKGRKMEAMSAEEKAAYPTKESLYAACAQRNIPIVAMKPFAGGNILKDHGEGRIKGLLNLTPVQCLSYIHSFQNVDMCPVPGVKDVAELEASLAYVTATEEEKDFGEINDSLAAKFENRCMYCNHCQPCTQGIDIAEVTKLADMAAQGVDGELRRRYDALESKAGDCQHCESCSERCPFGIDAAKNIQRALQLFGY